MEAWAIECSLSSGTFFFARALALAFTSGGMPALLLARRPSRRVSSDSRVRENATAVGCCDAVQETRSG